MENKNILNIAIVLTIGVILTGALLGPVISDATKTTETLDNSGYFHMEKYTAEDELTMVWDPTTPKQLTVNDVAYRPAVPINQFINLAIGDNWYVRYADGGANTFMQISTGTFTTIEATQNSTSPITIECSNGTATITHDTNVRTATYTEIYAISGDSGEYVMKNSNEPVYMAGNTEFTALGITGLGTGRAVLKITGDVDNGANVEVIASEPTGATTTNIVVNATPLTNYVGYSLSTITFDIVSDGVEYPATYSYFIVPASVTLELSEHLTPGQISLMGAIPVMVIVALLMAAVGAIALRRGD